MGSGYSSSEHNAVLVWYSPLYTDGTKYLIAHHFLSNIHLNILKVQDTADFKPAVTYEQLVLVLLVHRSLNLRKNSLGCSQFSLFMILYIQITQQVSSMPVHVVCFHSLANIYILHTDLPVTFCNGLGLLKSHHTQLMVSTSNTCMYKQSNSHYATSRVVIPVPFQQFNRIKCFQQYSTYSIKQ